MEFGRQYVAVAGVLCLLGAALWWLRRRGYASAPAGRRGRRMEALERLPLGPQHSLHLVRIGRIAAVVSCSPGGCSLLHTGALDDVDGGGLS